ncbi:MAG: hypothetical protein J6Y15_03330, partial [Bacteroidaceae bacterium]|nr:hypothetical protein [Bacteroidaceae bacterium]
NNVAGTEWFLFFDYFAGFNPEKWKFDGKKIYDYQGRKFMYYFTEIKPTFFDLSKVGSQTTGHYLVKMIENHSNFWVYKIESVTDTEISLMEECVDEPWLFRLCTTKNSNNSYAKYRIVTLDSNHVNELDEKTPIVKIANGKVVCLYGCDGCRISYDSKGLQSKRSGILCIESYNGYTFDMPSVSDWKTLAFYFAKGGKTYSFTMTNE